MNPLQLPITRWYDANARDLPWRRPGTSPWSVMVSEFMLQQTPVARVLPVHEEWLRTWPTPAALAAESSGEAVRAWGRLGYPRRALRLHAAAVVIRDEYDGEVPDSYEDLRRLPGVGDYTAAAIAAFGYGRRHVVLDTNIRRVLGRALGGKELPSTSVTATERELAASLLPEQDSAHWSVAVMELGALVCTSIDPSCGCCPINDRCRWQQTGAPAYDGPPRKVQTYAGTDRQVRGLLLGVLREAESTVPWTRLETVWPDAVQRERALTSLLDDGLVVGRADQGYSLPG